MYFWLIAEPDKEPEVICYPVGCVEVEAATHMTPTGRRWIGLDPASVPQRLYDKTTAAARVLCGLTGSRAIYGCDDWAYGYPIGGSPKPRWVTVEGNFCGPRLLGPREYPQIGKVLHERYVDFIDRAMAISN